MTRTYAIIGSYVTTVLTLVFGGLAVNTAITISDEEQRYPNPTQAQEMALNKMGTSFFGFLLLAGVSLLLTIVLTVVARRKRQRVA